MLAFFSHYKVVARRDGFVEFMSSGSPSTFASLAVVDPDPFGGLKNIEYNNLQKKKKKSELKRRWLEGCLSAGHTSFQILLMAKLKSKYYKNYQNRKNANKI